MSYRHTIYRKKTDAVESLLSYLKENRKSLTYRHKGKSVLGKLGIESSSKEPTLSEEELDELIEVLPELTTEDLSSLLNKFFWDAVDQYYVVEDYQWNPEEHNYF